MAQAHTGLPSLKRHADGHACGEECFVNGTCRGVKRVRSLLTSFEVFGEFIIRDPLTGSVDTSGILSKSCFQRWMVSRKQVPKDPPRSFKDALKAIIKGTNRCRPFSEDVEADLMTRLREDKTWPCFEGSGLSLIGSRGWRTLAGFHETRRKKMKEKAEKETKKKISGKKEEEEMSLGLPEHFSFTSQEVAPICPEEPLVDSGTPIMSPIDRDLLNFFPCNLLDL